MTLISSLRNDVIRECMEIYPVFQDPDTPFQTLPHFNMLFEMS